MRLLIVAATAQEIAPLIAALGSPHASGPRLHRVSRAGHDIDLLETGVGMVATAAWCSRALTSSRYDLALNLGVCGSFDPEFSPGTVVHVTSECLAELGAEDGDNFLTLRELNLFGADGALFQDNRIVNDDAYVNPVLAALPQARGITVNTVHGNARSIAAVTTRCAPQVESMEGAAFMYCARIHDVPFAELRAVSNAVEPRNRAAWKMKDAVGNLCLTAGQIIGTL